MSLPWLRAAFIHSHDLHALIACLHYMDILLTSCLPGKFVHRLTFYFVDEGIVFFEIARINIELIMNSFPFCSTFELYFECTNSTKRRTWTKHTCILLHYQQCTCNTSIIDGLIGKQKLPLLVATISSLFPELLVTPYPGLPLLLLYTAYRFKCLKLIKYNQI